MNESRAIATGTILGALIGAAAGYLFFSEAGKEVRDRLEPAVEDLRREFARFQKTIVQVGEMANDGVRAVSEFNAARQSSSATRMSH